MVGDVIEQTVIDGDEPEIRMSDSVLKDTIDLRTFLFETVYENELATSEFKKAWGILEGLWSKVHESPARFLDRGTVERDGVDVAARDFLAGMTDRYASKLYKKIYE